MGLYYVNAVLNGLKGRKEVGKQKLSSAEIALLVTIANNQPNPGSFHGDMDPICYGDVQTMADYAHLGQSTFFRTRNSLIESGLITYSPSERRKDLAGMGGFRTYNNVYRINLKVLREFYPDVDEWKQVILRISKEGDVPEGVLRALLALPDDDAGLPNRESVLPNRESALPNRESALPNRETNIYITKKENRQNNIMGGGADVDVDYLSSVVAAMARSLDVPVEEIGQKKVGEAIKGKLKDSVFRVVQNPSKFALSAKKPIGAMISELRNLPDKAHDSALQRMANKQKPGEYAKRISEASKEVKYLLDIAQKNTGYRDPRFLDEIAECFLKLTRTIEGNGVAAEICDKYKFTGPGKNDQTLTLAIGLKDELEKACSGLGGTHSPS